MGTKNNPGKFDCYHKAEPDEPTFTLLGRDPAAAWVIRFWIELRQSIGSNDDPYMILEATECANAMEAYCRTRGKETPSDDDVSDALGEILCCVGGTEIGDEW